MKISTIGKSLFTSFNRSLSIALLSCIALASCSKSGKLPSVSSIASYVPSGYAMLGPLSGATVQAYAVLANGSLDSTALCPPTTTDSNGYYAFNLTGVTLPSGPVAIRATGGSYTEEGSGTVINLGSQSFTSLLPDPSLNPTLAVTIGPLTQIAFLNFQAKVQAGIPFGKTLKDLAKNSCYTVSQAFGISDIVGVSPDNTFGTITNTTSGQYAVVLAAFSKAATSAGVDSYALAAAYAANLSSTGSMSGAAVTVTDLHGNTTEVAPPSMAALNGIVSGNLHMFMTNRVIVLTQLFL